MKVHNETGSRGKDMTHKTCLFDFCSRVLLELSESILIMFMDIKYTVAFEHTQSWAIYIKSDPQSSYIADLPHVGVRIPCQTFSQIFSVIFF